MPNLPLDIGDEPDPVLASYQRRFSSSVAKPSWTMRLPERSSGSTSPRFSRQSRSRAASSSPMMIRASEPPMNVRRSDRAALTFGSGIARSDMTALHVIRHDQDSSATSIMMLIKHLTSENTS